MYVKLNIFPIDYILNNDRANFIDIGRWKCRHITVAAMSISLRRKIKSVCVTCEKALFL